MNKKRKFLIRNIISDIGDCLVEDRIKILNLIALRVGSDNIYEEGTGCRVMFKLMSNDFLVEINRYIIEMKKATYINLADDKIPSWEKINKSI